MPFLSRFSAHTPNQPGFVETILMSSDVLATTLPNVISHPNIPRGVDVYCSVEPRLNYSSLRMRTRCSLVDYACILGRLKCRAAAEVSLGPFQFSTTQIEFLLFDIDVSNFNLPLPAL